MGYSFILTAQDDAETDLHPGGRSTFRDLLEEHELLGWSYMPELPKIERLAEAERPGPFKDCLEKIAAELRRTGAVLIEAIW